MHAAKKSFPRYLNYNSKGIRQKARSTRKAAEGAETASLQHIADTITNYRTIVDYARRSVVCDEMVAKKAVVTALNFMNFSRGSRHISSSESILSRVFF